MQSFQDFFTQYHVQLSDILCKINPNQVQQLLDQLEKARNSGRNIFLIGNGGSAAAATHWVCDMGKGINTEKSKRLKITALSDNTGIVTALGNDVSYDQVFKYQLENFAGPGDLLICLSVSGSSPNLLSAAQYAKATGCATAAIIGGYDGELKDICDLTITVPSKNYGIVEDVHLILNHILSQYIRQLNEGEQP